MAGFEPRIGHIVPSQENRFPSFVGSGKRAPQSRQVAGRRQAPPVRTRRDPQLEQANWCGFTLGISCSLFGMMGTLGNWCPKATGLVFFTRR